jgi:hypothetical protein
MWTDQVDGGSDPHHRHSDSGMAVGANAVDTKASRSRPLSPNPTSRA